MFELTQQKIRKILRAIQSGDIEIVRQFKVNYPEVHWSELRYAKSGTTILHVVARLGFTEIVEFLLSNYVPSGVDCRDRDGKTALHEAAQFTQTEVVRTLIRHGADLNALKRGDWTPLMLVCTKGDPNNNPDTMDSDQHRCGQLLLDSGANYTIKNKDGWTAFHLCCREGLIQLLCTLDNYRYLKTNEVKTGSYNGRTPLHIAALHGQLDISDGVLANAAYINARDNCGHTPIHDAVIGGDLEMFINFMFAGATMEDVTEDGSNILHIAAGCGRLSIISYILKDELAEIDCINFANLTPLHCAARNKQWLAYELLLVNGARTDLRDSFDRLAVDYWKL